MDKIQDKANKLFNEVRKKKIKVSNIGTHRDHKGRGKNDIRSTSDLSDNTCLFCEKVFINSHYLMKHVYRRHTENLVKLHRKCLLLDFNSSSDFKSLFTFLEEEFLVLKNELCIVKQAIGHEIPRNEDKEKCESKEPLEYVRHMNENNVRSDVAVADIDSKEIDHLKEKVHNIESNIQCLHNKIEEVNSVMKTEVLFRQDVLKQKILKEENFLREQESQLVELKQILLKELKCTLSKELSENDLKWKSKFAELKHDILKLDHVISLLKKQIDSPDYLTAVEKRLEQHIINFLGTPRRRAVKRSSKIRNKSSKGHRTSQNNKTLETNDCDKQITCSRPEVAQFKHSLESNKLHISPEELSFLITERLSQFEISHKTSKLSSTEYEEKLKLINSVKESLSKKYNDFSEIYKNINLYADQRVFSKLKNKKQRKLRFSEPLSVSEDKSFNLKQNEADILNKSFPVLEDKKLAHEYPKMLPYNNKNSAVFEKQRFIIPTSERFSFLDVGAGGECSGNFSEVYHTSVKEISTHKPTKEYKTTSPTVDTHNSEKTDCGSEKNSSFINFPLCSDYKNIDSGSVEMENTSYHMLDDFEKQDVPYFEPFKIYDNTELKDINSELDDFDENSLKSLSSWEDGKNSC